MVRGLRPKVHLSVYMGFHTTQKHLILFTGQASSMFSAPREV